MNKPKWGMRGCYLAFLCFDLSTKLEIRNRAVIFKFFYLFIFFIGFGIWYWKSNIPGFYSYWLNTANAASFCCLLFFITIFLTNEWELPCAGQTAFLHFFSFISIQWLVQKLVQMSFWLWGKKLTSRWERLIWITLVSHTEAYSSMRVQN